MQLGVRDRVKWNFLRRDRVKVSPDQSWTVLDDHGQRAPSPQRSVDVAVWTGLDGAFSSGSARLARRSRTGDGVDEPLKPLLGSSFGNRKVPSPGSAPEARPLAGSDGKLLGSAPLVPASKANFRDPRPEWPETRIAFSAILTKTPRGAGAAGVEVCVGTS